jgi:two-component system, OmpR family, alkaline phosphatase synthesis response regulator PhoP
MAEQILIVDDEPDILEFLSYNLTKEGYEVRTANNGREALTILESFHPQLLILDIMMPEMDGVELCKKIKDEKMAPQAVIAFLTARNEDFTQIAALDAGGDDFITKPIKPRVFLSRVKALLRRSDVKDGGVEQGVMAYGHLVIDSEKFSVTLNGTAVDLAKKEFQLIQLLASKPGKVFKRAEILQKIWGADVIVGDRTIDVHVRKVREKLGDEYIKTVKGIGYKFDF